MYQAYRLRKLSFIVLNLLTPVILYRLTYLVKWKIGQIAQLCTNNANLINIYYMKNYNLYRRYYRLDLVDSGMKTR